MRPKRYDIMIEGLAGLPGGIRIAHAADPLPAPNEPVPPTIFDEIEQADMAGEARFNRGMLEAPGRTPIPTLSFISAKRQILEDTPLGPVLERVDGKRTSIVAMLLNGCNVTIPFGDPRGEPTVMRAGGQESKPPERDRHGMCIPVMRPLHRKRRSMTPAGLGS